jgi:phosphoenolpyruvate carboxykinase (diphosphate)
MLNPSLQNIDDYVDGINNIVEAQQKVALSYFEDGSVEAAIPPLKVLLHIMAFGHYEGKDISDASLRNMFDRETVINSDWYKERLKLKQQKDTAYLTRQVAYLEDFKAKPENAELVESMQIAKRLEKAKSILNHVKTDAYLAELVGTIGVDPLFKG